MTHFVKSVHKPFLVPRLHLFDGSYEAVDVNQQLSCFPTELSDRQTRSEERVDSCFIVSRRMTNRALDFPDHDEGRYVTGGSVNRGEERQSTRSSLGCDKRFRICNQSLVPEPQPPGTPGLELNTCGVFPGSSKRRGGGERRLRRLRQY